jgi:hypothetical protein
MAGNAASTTMMIVNGNYNDWRLEDAWLDK